MAKKAAKETGYIHGFSAEEQKRLYDQARFLEPNVYRHVDISEGARVLEVGSGVGAQTEILLRRFPRVTVSCVDAATEQLAAARKRLKTELTSKRVTLHQADARKLPFQDNSFDAAFVCWLLEHLTKPQAVLSEINRVLKPGGVLYCTEVLNASFFLHPYSPATLKYWFEMNDQQWNLGGDPFIGAKLANLLLATHYRDIQTRFITEHYDNRTPKQRAEFLEYWTKLLLSSAPELLKTGKVDRATVTEMTKELRRLKGQPDTVIFLGYMQARAVAL